MCRRVRAMRLNGRSSVRVESQVRFVRGFFMRGGDKLGLRGRMSDEGLVGRQQQDYVGGRRGARVGWLQG